MAEAYGPAAAGFTGHFVDNTAVHRVVVELLQAGDPRPPPGDARPGP
jgi:hypothetical protein